MLQIRNFLATVFICASNILATEAPSSDAIDWILEDALEEEFVAIDVSEITTPGDFRNAVEFYNNGEYQQSVSLLENILALNAPDGRYDLIAFMAAECYREMEIQSKAARFYRYVFNRFPKSNKTPAAYYRMLQYAYSDRKGSLADTIQMAFEERYQIHPLYNSVQYIIGKLYFRLERYGEAGEILLKIPRSSSRHFQSQFLGALAFLQLKKDDKALLILDYIRKNSVDKDLIDNTNTVLGDIYFVRKKFGTALSYYRAVDKNNSQYTYVQVKMARAYLQKKEYESARDIARTYISKHEKSDHFFEMASILERVYTATGDMVKASQVKKLVLEQNVNARLSFEINEELMRVWNMVRSWRHIEYYGLERNDNKLIKEARKNIKQCKNLLKKFRAILYERGAISGNDYKNGVKGLAEQRYIMLLRKDLAELEKSKRDLQRESEYLAEEEEIDSTDLSLKELRADLNRKNDSLTTLLTEMKNEYTDLMRFYNETKSLAGKFGREMQAKYIDLAFIKYLEKKGELEELNKDIASRSRQKADTSSKDSAVAKDSIVDVVPMFTEIEIKAKVKSIEDDRFRLIDHMEIFLDVNPGSNYTPHVLYRLAELYFDKSSEDFTRRLDEFEKQLETNDSALIDYPEFSLDKTIEMYSRIVDHFPMHWLADDALFYKALALKNVGREKEANDEFTKLITDYSESEYFVEANMNIGRYFFSNPKIQGGKGYKLAEEAYKKVMYYPEHPQFVYAIYHLGWCYYMQDMYDDAIAVFKYLVEKGELEFDLSKVEDKQVANPLMREEAVDYIAVSFDEKGGDINVAIKFLSLIGNVDYSALVLKRIGELREEDLDYVAATTIYRRIINEYAISSIAPYASEKIIKILESNNKHQQAMKERRDFFKRYAQGSKWHSELMKRDPAQVKVIDSMAIAIGLYVGDALYREAENEKRRELYEDAVDNYELLVKAYPNDPTTSDALWNLAVILNTKLNKKKTAIKKFISFSKSTEAETKRREQAALNAIAIAQKMMSPDSLLKSDKLDAISGKVVEAVKNYLALFPDGESAPDVVMTMGSVYYNRKMFSNAIKSYRIITNRGHKAPRYYDAGFLIAKCHFGMENWTKAAAGFKKVWKDSKDELQKKEAFKLLLQSKFLYAKQLFDSKAFEKAAQEYYEIDRKYPGSEYGDITLFNSAEAYEQLKDWKKACKTFYEVYEKYPNSKLAPDALFNAASDYEKSKKYEGAVTMYELIVEKYHSSEKAKDALFNVGFCYEKLGKLEKMAEANERFSQLYPGEKDVEFMILRSAEYYYKTSMCEKSIKVYRNYITQYPQSDRSVEAYYKIGKCFQKEDDTYNASLSFDQAEAHNKRLQQADQGGNNYYAAEAAFSSGIMKKEILSEISFDVSQEEAKRKQKQKTELLLQAVKVFRRAIEYKSERMFEAAFHIGEMYEQYAYAWEKQKLQKSDPIKMAVAKKDIYLTCSKLMQKSFTPYKKVIELSSGIDSLKAGQLSWVDSAKTRLARNYLTAGSFMNKGVSVMHKAPIPSKIKDKPIYLFQYKKQLLETMEPLKTVIRDYYKDSNKELKELAISKDAEHECFDNFGKVNFLIPNQYDKLAENILIASEELPDDMNEEEREEYVFQFEDMVFELQDKALFGFEDALEIVKKENLSGTTWHAKIMRRLARLSPETYGKGYYLSKIAVTDDSWIFHSDSVKNWHTTTPFKTGWKQVREVSMQKGPIFTVGTPQVIWGSGDKKHMFFWKNVFINGTPREGTLYLACNGSYRLYVNQKLLAADTAKSRSITTVDSIAGISSILQGGDNIIAVEAFNGDSLNHGFALSLSALVDTSQHFKSSAKMPDVKILKKVGVSPDTASQAVVQKVDTAKVTDKAVKVQSSKQPVKTKDEIMSAIAGYKKKAEEASAKIKKERLQLQKLHIKTDNVDKKIRSVQEEIQKLKNLLNDNKGKKSKD